MNDIFEATHKVLADHKIGARLADVTPYGSPRQSQRCLSLSLHLDNTADLPKLQQAQDKFALAANCDNVMVVREGGAIWVDFVLPESEWKVLHFRDICESGIGVSVSGKVVDYSVSTLHAYPHALVVGATGSGKSSTMRSMIGRLLKQSSNDGGTTVELYICDPNDELAMFQVYSQSYHTNNSPIAAFYEKFCVRRSGKDKNGSYCVLFIDEVAPAIGSKATGWNTKAIAQLCEIGQEGRKYRMHLVGGIQHPIADNLPTTISNMCTVRFVGKVQNGKASEMALGVTYPNAAHLVGKGDTIYYGAGKLQRFQAGFFRLEDEFTL